MNSREVCKSYKVTYRELDYWTCRGYLSDDAIDASRHSQGTGTYREYAFRELRRLDIMVRLVRVGVKPAKAAEYARAMVAGEGRSIALPGGVSIAVSS